MTRQEDTIHLKFTLREVTFEVPSLEDEVINVAAFPIPIPKKPEAEISLLDRHT